MMKQFCDECGKEIDGEPIHINVSPSPIKPGIPDRFAYDVILTLCEECAEE